MELCACPWFTLRLSLSFKSAKSPSFFFGCGLYISGLFKSIKFFGYSHMESLLFSRCVGLFVVVVVVVSSSRHFLPLVWACHARTSSGPLLLGCLQIVGLSSYWLRLWKSWKFMRPVRKCMRESIPQGREALLGLYLRRFLGGIWGRRMHEGAEGKLEEKERDQRGLALRWGPSQFGVMVTVLCFSPEENYLRPSPHLWLLKTEAPKSWLFPCKTLSFPCWWSRLPNAHMSLGVV